MSNFFHDAGLWLFSSFHCVIFLLQDDARKLANEWVQKTEIFEGKDCAVRVNSVESGLCEKDMIACLSDEVLPSTILLPKVEYYQQLQWV